MTTLLVFEDKMQASRAGSRNSLRWPARWMLVVMLGLQFVLAAQACVLPMPASSAMTMTVPCEEAGTDMAACLIQCQKTADQIKPSVDFHFDALLTPTTWALALFVVPASPKVAVGATPLLRPGGPSLQILFCSFQS